MSKQPEEQKVFSFLQKQLDKSKEDHDTMQVMLDEMKGFKNDVIEIKNDVLEVKNEVTEKFEVITVMVEEIRNDSKIRDHEAFELQQTVYKKSVELAKDRYSDDDGDFLKVVGSYRRMIWSKLKVHFEVNKYSHLRRIDFHDAMEFAVNFKPEKYM